MNGEVVTSQCPTQPRRLHESPHAPGPKPRPSSKGSGSCRDASVWTALRYNEHGACGRASPLLGGGMRASDPCQTDTWFSRHAELTQLFVRPADRGSTEHPDACQSNRSQRPTTPMPSAPGVASQESGEEPRPHPLAASSIAPESRHRQLVEVGAARAAQDGRVLCRQDRHPREFIEDRGGARALERSSRDPQEA